MRLFGILMMLMTVSLSFSNCSVEKKVELKEESKKELKLGIDQIDSWSKQLLGRSVGVVSNQTSVINGVHLVDTLLSLNIDLKCVFAPEHGFRGNHDAGASVENGVDKNTGLPIYSLHGKYKKPKKEWIEGLDVIIFDIQDVGVRFYTYISTLHYVMESCAENGIKVMLLDRPNLHDHYVDGPVLDKEYKSFVGMHPVPVVYGMTIGEYGRMINGEYWLNDFLRCDLEVITLKNYERGSWNKSPIPPSPNLPNVQSIKLYPSLCFFEGTKISAGRGTDFPFQVFGHPLLKEMSFNFKPVSKPGYSRYPKHENQMCYGKDLRQVDVKSDSLINWTYLIDAYKSFEESEDFFIDNNFIYLLSGTREIKAWVEESWSNEQIRQSYSESIIAFKDTRQKYLIY